MDYSNALATSQSGRELLGIFEAGWDPHSCHANKEQTANEYYQDNEVATDTNTPKKQLAPKSSWQTSTPRTAPPESAKNPAPRNLQKPNILRRKLAFFSGWFVKLMPCTKYSNRMTHFSQKSKTSLAPQQKRTRWLTSIDELGGMCLSVMGRRKRKRNKSNI